jgi:8-oxo-dGTP diphosphatase
MRYDFSGPKDIEQYLDLTNRLRAAKGPQGVSAILISRHGQVLLQQRDDNPAIRYPGHWSLFGGTIEEGETPAEAVAREVHEEIDFELRNFGLFREFVQNNKREFAFAGELTAGLDELTLREGQGMNFFYPSQLPELQIRPDDKETLEQYFGA